MAVLHRFYCSCYDGHLGYQNKTILATLNLHVASVLEEKMFLKNFKMGLLEWNNFGNSESPCCLNASHMVLEEKMFLKNFKRAAMNFSNSESPCCPQCLLSSVGSILCTYGLRDDMV